MSNFVLILKSLILISILPFAFAAYQDKDNFFENLENAKKTFVYETELNQKVFLKRMEEQIKTIAKSGNLEVVQRLIIEKKDFEGNNSRIPVSKEFKNLVLDYQKQLKKNKDLIQNIYEKTIKEFTKKLDLDNAVKLKKELEEFLKTGEVVFGLPDNPKEMKKPPFEEPKKKDQEDPPKKDQLKNEELSKKTFVNSIGMKFVRVPPGKFMMGSPNDEKDRNVDEILHEVEIKESFFIGAYEVTQQEWLKIMNNNPSRDQGDNLPITMIRGNEINDFIKKLNEKEKRRYSLPSEEQWEYACRAGTSTPFSFGYKISEKLAHFDASKKTNCSIPGRYTPRLKPVGSYLPNPWGIYDMHGSVWEVCKDVYKPYLKEGEFPKEYFERIPESIRNRTHVYRGGNAVKPGNFARSAARAFFDYTSNFTHGGFRLILTDDVLK